MKYRLKHNNYKNWEIQERKTVKATKKGANKRVGEQYWDTLKYPGKLDIAAAGLLDLVVSDSDKTDIRELIEVVQKAEESIVRELKKMVIENKELGSGDK